MCRRCLVIGIVAFFSLALLPVSTWANCEQADLEGTWNVEVWGGCPSGTQCWDQCTLTIGADGTVAAVGTYIDCFGVSCQVTGGQLTLYPDCSIEGAIVTSSGTTQVGPGAIVADQLILGTEQ